MDSNSDTNRQTSHLNNLINKCNLYDPMKHIHPELEHIPTCKTGSKRIDIILISHAIISSIQNISYLNYDTITYTDHKPIVLDLDTTTLFKSHQTNTILSSVRVLNLNNPKKMETYTDTITDDIAKHKIENKIEDMECKFKTKHTSTNLIQTYETISDRITRMQKHAERACGRVPFGMDWSPELKQAGLTYLLWKSIVNYIQRHMKLPQTIYDKHASLKDPIPITHNIIQVIKTMREKKEHYEPSNLKPENYETFILTLEPNIMQSKTILQLKHI